MYRSTEVERELEEQKLEIAALKQMNSSNKQEMIKMSDLVEKLNHASSVYKSIFDSEMKRLNPHLDWSMMDT